MSNYSDCILLCLVPNVNCTLFLKATGIPSVASDWLTNSSYQQQQGPSRDDHVSETSSESNTSIDESSRRKKARRRHSAHRKESEDEIREREKRKHKHHRKHKKSSSRVKTSRKPSEPSKPNTIWISETNFEPKDAYRLDSKSDLANLSYDTLYSNDQASYKRYYGNLCLGLGRGQKIKFTDKRNRVKKRHDTDQIIRYYQGECEPTETTVLKFNFKEEIPYDEETEEEGDKEAEPLEPLPDILLLTVSKLEKDEEEETKATPETYLKEKTSVIVKLVHGDKSDNVDLWLQYIALQDEYIHWSTVPADEGWGKMGMRKKFRDTIAEKKIAIYENALMRFPYNTDFILGHMKLVESLWDTEKLVAKWKDIVFYNANQSTLWVHYIEFCMSRFSFFQTNSIIAVFIKAISTLAAIAEGKLVSHKPEVDAERKVLAMYIFFCYFLRQVGYTERAISSFQALIEFNRLYPRDLYPDNCYYPRIGRRKGLETFWETDEPRFGEEGAVGWENWEHRETTPPHPLGLVTPQKYDKLLHLEEELNDNKEEEEDDIDIDMKLVSGLPINEAWVKLERYRDEENSLPGRLSAPVNSKMNSDTEDPEHITLFDDLIEIQFIMTDPELHYLLLLEFVRFLGVPCPGQSILHATFPTLAHVITMATEIMGNPSCLFNSLRMQGSQVWSCYFQPCPLGKEYGVGLDNSLGEDLFCDSSYSEKSSVSDSYPTFSSHMKHFISTVFNQSMALVPKDTNAGMVLMCTWLQFELLYIKELLKSEEDVTLHVEQLHSLAVELVTAFTRPNYSFLWDFTHSLEQLLPVKNKTSPLSKALLEPFVQMSFPFDEMFSMAMTFVEYHLGLREPMNCYLKCKRDRWLALHALLSLKDFEFDPVNLPTVVPKFTPNDLLKTEEFFQLQIRKVLSQISSKMISIKKDSFYIHFPKLACHAYFVYLSEGMQQTFDLCENYEFEIKRIGTDTAVPNHTTLIPLLENLYILQTRLIIVMNCPPYNTIKPSVLRIFITRALELLPCSHWLLHSLLEAEKRPFITGKLRRYFEYVISNDSCDVHPIIVLFAVRAELERQNFLLKCMGRGEYTDESLSSITNRVRALFQKGSDCRSCQRCPAFWRCFMKFEVSEEREREKKRRKRRGEK